MKLYYAPGACSLADHIILEETGLSYEGINARASDKAGAELAALNPMGAVPVLVLNDGSPLTQNSAILTYLAEQKPELKLIPPPGTIERARCLEMLAFVNSDVHNAFGAIFGGDLPPAEMEEGRKTVVDLMDLADKRLGKGPFTLGAQFTIADAYLFVVHSWADHLKFDKSRWPSLAAFSKRVAERPAVLRALKAEGLI